MLSSSFQVQCHQSMWSEEEEIENSVQNSRVDGEECTCLANYLTWSLVKQSAFSPQLCAARVDLTNAHNCWATNIHDCEATTQHLALKAACHPVFLISGDCKAGRHWLLRALNTVISPSVTAQYYWTVKELFQGGLGWSPQVSGASVSEECKCDNK